MEFEETFLLLLSACIYIKDRKTNLKLKSAVESNGNED
jgi:hypothetical protein